MATATGGTRRKACTPAGATRRSPSGSPSPSPTTTNGARLTDAIGRTDWANDPFLATVDGRHERHDELDAGIAEWASAQAPDEVVDLLRPLGIPVAKVLAVPRMYDDPQLVARGYYVPLDHEKTGVRRYPGWPMRFSFTDVQHRFGAPTLGQHNREVLREFALSDEEIDALERDGIIGNRMAAD